METHSLYMLKTFSPYDSRISKNLIIWKILLIHTMVYLRQLNISVPQSQYGGDPTAYLLKSLSF